MVGIHVDYMYAAGDPQLSGTEVAPVCAHQSGGVICLMDPVDFFFRKRRESGRTQRRNHPHHEGKLEVGN